MPLIKSRSKKAFSENVAKEMDAGKPQKQALAIAYNTQRAARARKKMAHGGEATGVNRPQWGEHQNKATDKGESEAGHQVRRAGRGLPEIGSGRSAYEPAKEIHRETLNEMRGMKKPNLYAQGGKVGYGNLGSGSDTASKTSVSTHEDQRSNRQGQEMLAREHARDACMGPGCPGCSAMDCYAYGGMAREDRAPHMEPGYGSLPAEGREATNRSISPMEDQMERTGHPGEYKGIADMIRRQRMAKGGKVESEYEFDIDDQLEHPEYYDDLNAKAANEKLYDDTYGTDPRDSNQKGDRLSDEDEHSKSMFKKIKLKRAQPGDRGDY